MVQDRSDDVEAAGDHVAVNVDSTNVGNNHHIDPLAAEK